MKRFTILLALMVTTGALYAQGALTVTSVVSTPVTGITVITYDLQIVGKVNGTYDIAVDVSFNNGISYLPVPPAHLSGDVTGVTPGAGKKITWNGAAGFPNRYSTETKVRLTATSDVFVCGESTVTFSYNGSQVTYGTVVGANNKCWLDRNLGASQVVTKSNGTEAYGDLFQWGRAADGHQIRSPLSGTTTDLSGSDNPGHGNFILSSDASPYDWRNPKNDNLWQGVTGINNPCPTGWRVPTKGEWEAELGIPGKNNSPLNLPAAGYRSEIDGDIKYTGGYYWSSDVTGTDAWRLEIGTGMVPSRRADGFSVRCIKGQASIPIE